MTPLNVSYLTVSNPGGTVITGTSFNVIVQAFDIYNNLATNYAGQIKLSPATTPQAATLVGNYQFTFHAGRRQPHV